MEWNNILAPSLDREVEPGRKNIIIIKLSSGEREGKQKQIFLYQLFLFPSFKSGERKHTELELATYNTNNNNKKTTTLSI